MDVGGLLQSSNCLRERQEDTDEESRGGKGEIEEEEEKERKCSLMLNHSGEIHLNRWHMCLKLSWTYFWFPKTVLICGIYVSDESQLLPPLSNQQD